VFGTCIRGEGIFRFGVQHLGFWISSDDDELDLESLRLSASTRLSSVTLRRYKLVKKAQIRPAHRTRTALFYITG
jgi:hypothetical protein